MLYDNCTDCTSCTQRGGCDNCMRGITILVGTVAGIVFGAAFTLLYAFSLLPFAFVGIAVALGIAILYLVLILAGGIISGIKSRNAEFKECVCCNIGSIFFGIFGTLVFGILALSAGVAAVSVIGIVLVALATFCFAYMLTTILFLVICLVCR